jgi:unsaturated chondroitin disaccharide hydrolase
MSVELRAQAIEYIAKSLRDSVEVAGGRFPVATEQGIWELNDGGWTGGYFAGMLWLMYAETGDEYWRDHAEKYTWLLEKYRTNVDMSDIGILYWPSFDLGYSLTLDESMREAGLEGARSMMKRFIPGGGYVQNWGRLGEQDQMGFVIIDCLINLDHLYWAAEQTGEPVFSQVATSHAERTRVSHVRQDFSSFQVVEFNPDTGDMLRGFTKQGYTDESTWSRGQSWGIYGFTRVYKHTKERKFLEAAIGMADWFIERLPPDFVPYWDFDAPRIPNEPRDTSAASMAASAMLELATFVEDPERASHYRSIGSKIVASLTENYSTRDLLGRNDGVLTGATYFYEIGRSVDQACIWGDFYYLEALQRWQE